MANLEQDGKLQPGNFCTIAMFYDQLLQRLKKRVDLNLVFKGFQQVSSPPLLFEFLCVFDSLWFQSKVQCLSCLSATTCENKNRLLKSVTGNASATFTIKDKIDQIE